MNNENPVWKSVKGTLQAHPRTGALVAVLVVLSVTTSLLPPLVLEKAVDSLTEGRGIPWQLGALYIGLIVLSDCCETAQNGAITLFGQKVTHGLRSTLCAKLDRLPARYFTGHPSGQTASVFVNDGDTIDALYSDGIVGMLADACKLLGIWGSCGAGAGACSPSCAWYCPCCLCSPGISSGGPWRPSGKTGGPSDG